MPSGTSQKTYDPEREQELYADPMVQNIFALLHEAGKRSHCQWNREFGDDYHGLMAEVTSLRETARLLAWAYRVSGDERHLFDLERLVYLNYRSEGPIICLLVAISIEALFYDELENLEDPQRFLQHLKGIDVRERCESLLNFERLLTEEMTFLRTDKADYFQELMAAHEDYWAFQFSDPMLARDYAFFLETMLGYHQELRRQRHLTTTRPICFRF